MITSFANPCKIRQWLYIRTDSGYPHDGRANKNRTTVVPIRILICTTAIISALSYGYSYYSWWLMCNWCLFNWFHFILWSLLDFAIIIFICAYLVILKWSSYYFTWILLLEILHFLPLIDRWIDFLLILIIWTSASWLNSGFLANWHAHCIAYRSKSVMHIKVNKWMETIWLSLSVKSQFDNYYYNWKSYN